ncbi:Hypothetical predicted protein [Podarcis lilfordi]|uniref:Uncharacterized protein n=1 Tax=Podarcis lilfordi TaxID=74358 RepID=A0AA35PDK7_9SAUR|nr:Hypothetical predicted protein [Podarcis lilfordi]
MTCGKSRQMKTALFPLDPVHIFSNNFANEFENLCTNPSTVLSTFENFSDALAVEAGRPFGGNLSIFSL